MLAKPEIISRGFTDNNFSELRKEIVQIIQKTIEELHAEERYSWNAKKKQIKKNVTKHLKERTKKEPMIIPVLIEI